mgnify:FL=1|jgi:hypothetical protein
MHMFYMSRWAPTSLRPDFVAASVRKMTRSLKAVVNYALRQGVWFLETFVRNRARLFVHHLPDGNNME